MANAVSNDSIDSDTSAATLQWHTLWSISQRCGHRLAGDALHSWERCSRLSTIDHTGLIFREVYTASCSMSSSGLAGGIVCCLCATAAHTARERVPLIELRFMHSTSCCYALPETSLKCILCHICVQHAHMASLACSICISLYFCSYSIGLCMCRRVQSYTTTVCLTAALTCAAMICCICVYCYYFTVMCKLASERSLAGISAKRWR
eukprot:20319-Heterococcus_DN1.PRE.3